MASRSVLWAVIPLSVLLYGVFTLNASGKTELQTIQTVDAARINAQLRGDVTALNRFLGDDLTYVHASGLIEGKAEFLAKLQSGKRLYKSIRDSDQHVRILRGVAIITAISDITVASGGQDHELSLRVTEVYANRDGDWQLVAYQSTRIQA